jgi:hypothetical protein
VNAEAALLEQARGAIERAFQAWTAGSSPSRGDRSAQHGGEVLRAAAVANLWRRIFLRGNGCQSLATDLADWQRLPISGDGCQSLAKAARDWQAMPGRKKRCQTLATVAADKNPLPQSYGRCRALESSAANSQPSP